MSQATCDQKVNRTYEQKDFAQLRVKEDVTPHSVKIVRINEQKQIWGNRDIIESQQNKKKHSETSLEQQIIQQIDVYNAQNYTYNETWMNRENYLEKHSVKSLKNE